MIIRISQMLTIFFICIATYLYVYIYVYLFICVRKILIQLFDNVIDGAWI